MLRFLLFAACTVSGWPAAIAADTDKTLVAWVTIRDLDVRAGSVLTIQDGDEFDGIVFAEISPRRWMAGSNFFSRTAKVQDDWLQETAESNSTVQIAVVYQDDQIAIYRNGQPVTRYQAQNINLLERPGSYAVFGLRHVGGNGSIDGRIDDARIYRQALTRDQLAALRPNQTSDVRPFAWWDFEGPQITEKTGTFPITRLAGNARVKQGQLVLGPHAVVISGRSAAAVQQAVDRAAEKFPRPYHPTTPTLPDPIPDTWLTYHLAHPGPDRAIPADPNCAIYYKDRYHLFYIHQSFGHSFAHVSSTDMVHWKWHTTTLTPPKTGHGMFSGTAFLTRAGRPAIIYHGQGSNRNQIAVALDDQLDRWSPPWPVEPVTRDGQPAPMRHWDPDCWRDGDYYYAIGGGSNPTLSRSRDLKHWEFQGELFHPDFPTDLGVAKSEDTSCPNMFRIGDQWMLLCISHQLGCRYYLGNFRDGKFLPHHHAMMNWARWDFFAPESLLTPDGRRVMWAWCTPWVNGMQKQGRSIDFPELLDGQIQPGIQSLPRQLSLTDDGTLRIEPLTELQSLRGNEWHREDLDIPSGQQLLLPDIRGDTLELELVIEHPVARRCGVRILSDESGSHGFDIITGTDRDTLTVGYVQPPLVLQPDEPLRLRLFIDKNMIEVFANQRQAAVAWHRYRPRDTHIVLLSEGGSMTVRHFRAWQMKSIYKAR